MLAERLTEEEMDAVLVHLVQPAMLAAYTQVAEPYLREVRSVVKTLGIQPDEYSRGYLAGLGRAVTLFPMIAPTPT